MGHSTNAATNTLRILFLLVFVINLVLFFKVFRSELPQALYAEEVTAETLKDVGKDNDLQTPPDPYPGATLLTANVADTKAGALTLVNEAHPFDFDVRPLVTTRETPEDVFVRKNKSYSVRDRGIVLAGSLIDPLNTMMADFETAVGNKGLMVLSAYRNYEDQQAAYAQNHDFAAGHSDHHTGYAFDLALYQQGAMSAFDGTGDLAWFLQNMGNYGFILRYPADKEAVTGHAPSSDHFRYVGMPHAAYMVQNNLALEEYIDLLGGFTYDNRLTYTDAAGRMYAIYTVAVPADGTAVPVPSEEGALYSLSGDNAGRLVVTVTVTP